MPLLLLIFKGDCILIKSIKMQMTVLLKRKSTIIMYFFMLFLVLYNFFKNIITYYGFDIMRLFHPMKVGIMSDYNAIGFYFTEFYPLLVIIPAAFSFLIDRNSKEFVFIQSRVGKRNYYWGKLISVFLITFLVFTIPLFIEFILNCVAFPLSATGDPTAASLYDLGYIDSVRRYFFSSLYIFSPYLYNLFFIIVFGTFSGILATFVTAISTFKFMKFRIMIFIPVYMLLYIFTVIGTTFKGISFSTNYFNYLRMYNGVNKSGLAYFVFMITALDLSFLIMTLKSRRDNLE